MTLENDKWPTGHPRTEFTVPMNRRELAHQVDPAEAPTVESEPISGREDNPHTPARQEGQV